MGKSQGADFIFRSESDGTIEFVGKFEDLYQEEADPWGQSGVDERMGAYYTASRKRLVKTIESLPARNKVLEVGSGLGFVTEQLRLISGVEAAFGLEISETAVAKAKIKFPDCNFAVGNIVYGPNPFQGNPFDVVILNQLLWYLLEDFNQALSHSTEFLGAGGRLIVCNAFFRSGQKYGRELIDGFQGLLDFLAQSPAMQSFKVEKHDLLDDKRLEHLDGIVVLTRC